eukprot:GHVS01077355.1.p1 GENE.GHVS01077355.1~~GHVS01077355.1.p1  ORF type:complete len:142 (-),score=5.65 GHVS01077355.1:251-676(-)
MCPLPTQTKTFRCIDFPSLKILSVCTYTHTYILRFLASACAHTCITTTTTLFGCVSMYVHLYNNNYYLVLLFANYQISLATSYYMFPIGIIAPNEVTSLLLLGGLIYILPMLIYILRGADVFFCKEMYNAHQNCYMHYLLL